jgi:hypothetical protein
MRVEKAQNDSASAYRLWRTWTREFHFTILQPSWCKSCKSGTGSGESESDRCPHLQTRKLAIKLMTTNEVFLLLTGSYVLIAFLIFDNRLFIWTRALPQSGCIKGSMRICCGHVWWHAEYYINDVSSRFQKAARTYCLYSWRVYGEVYVAPVTILIGQEHNGICPSREGHQCKKHVLHHV